MVIHKLHLQNFRNISNRCFEFHPQKNLLFGVNGSGKTSVLEAIHFLAFSKPITGDKQNLIQYHADTFRIDAMVDFILGRKKISSHFGNDSLILVDHHKTAPREINRFLFPVFFSSHSFFLIIDQRNELRRLMDRFIYGVNHLYLPHILRYNRILKQKNNLLKQVENLTRNKELNSWNQGLAETGSVIISMRKTFINQLNQELAHLKTDFPIQVDYFPSPEGEYGDSTASFFHVIIQAFEKEKKIKFSSVGPHRDRYEIRIDSRLIQWYSSGERKRFLLYVYFSFMELFRRYRNETPIFLFDDFDSAMDQENIDRLLHRFPSMQVIATSVSHRCGFDLFIPLHKEYET